MMHSRTEMITPEIAAAYLQKNYSNRNIQRSTVRNYARDIKNDCWQLSPDGISFYENGTLANGQHRLQAVIETGIPVEMYVTYGVPNTTTIFDRGRNRTISNIMKMNGIRGPIAQNALIGGVNFLFDLCGNNHVTDSIRIDFCLENEQILSSCLSIVSSGSTKGLCKQAPVITAAFCALYCGVSEETLRQFFAVANTGFYNATWETAAIVLRNYLLYDYRSANTTSKRQMFGIATNAIMDYTKMAPRKRPYRAGVKYAYFETVKKNAVDKYINSYVK